MVFCIFIYKAIFLSKARFDARIYDRGFIIIMENKKVIFSGVQPTGKITIGNYLGAIKNWTTMQEEFNSIFCVVDLHSITVNQVPAELRKNT